jgi:hypothetical protein
MKNSSGSKTEKPLICAENHRLRREARPASLPLDQAMEQVWEICPEVAATF